MVFYPPIRELANPHPTSRGNDNQLISVDEESSNQTLTVYEAIRGDQDDAFDVDLCNDTIDKDPKPIKELVKLQLGPTHGQCIQLSRDLTSHEYKRITEVLRRNEDLFARQPFDMAGIRPSIICHALAICSQAKPVSHKKRKTGEERHKAVKEEVDKLLKA